MAINEKTFGGALGKKFGPLPAGLWLGFVAVGAYLYQRRKGAGAGAGQGQGKLLPDTLNYYTTIGPGGDTTNYYGPRPVPGGTAGHVRGPLPPQPVPPGPISHGGGGSDPPPLRWPPPNPGPGEGPGVPNGTPAGVPLPVIGAVANAGRLPARGLAFLRSLRPQGGSQPVAWQGTRAVSTTVRPAVKAAQDAAMRAPGLVGIAAAEGTPSERGRSTMPPAPALRQRPAPPRIVDNEKQRNVKHEVALA